MNVAKATHQVSCVNCVYYNRKSFTCRLFHRTRDFTINTHYTSQYLSVKECTDSSGYLCGIDRKFFTESFKQ